MGMCDSGFMGMVTGSVTKIHLPILISVTESKNIPERKKKNTEYIIYWLKRD